MSGIHLDIRPGEYCSIAGPSGCGKTTLLSILGLLDTPSDGSYSLKGHEVANLSFARRARIRNREIGFIFQSFNLIGDLTVFENVELPLTYRGMACQRAQSICDRSLGARGHGASWQNTCRASSPAVNSSASPSPARLPADRRFCWRTSRPVISIRAMAKPSWICLQELHAVGATICMVTHDERFAQHADRTVHLFDGRVVEDRIAA